MNTAQARKITLKDILFMPVGCLVSLSPPVVFAILAVTALAGGIVYYNVNFDFWGLSSPPFSDLTINPDFSRIEMPGGNYLTLTYETPFNSSFNGLVRHISPIRLGAYPILTHDILVTSGEFANPDIVHTSVIDHHFSWTSAKRSPQGAINLLHTVPVNMDIYSQLMALRIGQTVRITGREIYRIEAFSPDGNSRGWWQDSGCNTLLVTAVEAQP